MNIQTYPEMNEKIKDILMISDDQSCQYAAQRIEDLEKHLEKLEDFEAKVILCDEVWNTDSGLPTFTRALYNEWMELQEERNKLLGRFKK